MRLGLRERERERSSSSFLLLNPNCWEHLGSSSWFSGNSNKSERERRMVGASLVGLQDHLKLAREYALEGLYDTSIIFFDGALAQINKYLYSLTLLINI